MNRSRYGGSAGVLLLVVLPWVSPLSAAPQSDLAQKVRAIAERAIESNNAVGLSIGISRGGEVLLAEGYGHANLESGVPATADTVYRIGSLTKQFTAAAILRLVDEDKIALDDPITKYLPEYPVQDHVVTIRNLLQHTSGIPSYTSQPSYRALIRQDASHEEMLARFKDLPFEFEPGSQFRYSNSGYYLLGVIIETAAGMPYEKYLQTALFDPLGLERTCYDRPDRLIIGRASGYERVKGEFQNATFVSMTQPFSAGALASSVKDLLTWQHALMSDRVVSESSRRLMTTRGVLSDGKSIAYGMGLLIGEDGGRTIISHGGGINGFRSHLGHAPETGYTIAVLGNSENSQPGPILKLIAEHLEADDDAGAARR